MGDWRWEIGDWGFGIFGGEDEEMVEEEVMVVEE